MRMRLYTAAAFALALGLTGCATAGTPVSAPPTSSITTTVSQTSTTEPAVMEPGRLPGATADITVTEEAYGASNTVMALAISDAQDYWVKADAPVFQRRSAFLALPGPDDSNDCLELLDFARACTAGIVWEPAKLDPILAEHGELAVVAIAAHEVGHLVELSRNPHVENVAEPLADCLAGEYMSTIAEGRSTRFTGSRTDIREAVMATNAATEHDATRSVTDRWEDFSEGFYGKPGVCFGE